MQKLEPEQKATILQMIMKFDMYLSVNQTRAYI